MSLLRDPEYSMKVSEIIREALGDEVSDIKHKWELMKLKVLGYTLQFASRKAKSSRQVLLALEKIEAVRTKSTLIFHTG